jgi:type III pantothenate kinase
MNYGAVDIGNSRLKIMIESEFAAFTHNDNSIDEAIEYILKHSEFPLTLGYSSVNKERSGPLIRKLKIISGIKLFNAEQLIQKQSVLKYNNIKGIGIDRLLGLYRAIRKYKPPLITVDCGTAITINVVNAKQHCLGGAIFPGLNMMSEALGKGAKGLKKYEIRKPQKAAGRSTERAISSGLIYGTCGAIYEIYNMICRQEFDCMQVKMIVTGGTAKLILPYLKNSITKLHYEKNLVLEGILNLLWSI